MNIDEQCVKLCCPIKSQVRFYFFELSAFEEGILFTQQDITYTDIDVCCISGHSPLRPRLWQQQ